MIDGGKIYGYCEVDGVQLASCYYADSTGEYRSHFDLSQKMRNFKPFIAINNKKPIKNPTQKIVIFCQIFAFFDDFSKFCNMVSTLHFEKCQNIGKK